MNFKQCIIFREIAKTKNFTKAANNLYLTQSAVSHTIKELEKEAGTQLFERLHRSVKLTPPGEIFLYEILPIIEEFESVEAHLPNLEKQAPIKIASCITYAQMELPQLLQKFNIIYPEVQFNIQVFPASESIMRLETGKVDLAFIEGKVVESSFISKKIADYHLCVVAGPNVTEKRINFIDLLQLPLLLRERGSAVRETFESFAVLQGFKIFPVWESVDSQALISAVKAGIGVAVLPHIIVKEALKRGELKEIQIADWKLTNDITALVRNSRYQPSFLNNFWELLQVVD